MTHCVCHNPSNVVCSALKEHFLTKLGFRRCSRLHTYNDTPCQVAERYWIMTVPTFASFSNIYAVLINGCPYTEKGCPPKGQIWSDCQMVAIIDCTLMAGLPQFLDLIEFQSKPSCFAVSPVFYGIFYFWITFSIY